MIQTIHDETQLVDRDTHTSVHANLGMFVLVIMCHGDFGTVLSKEGGSYKHIRLVDIYRLLSPKEFPGMKGKPKMIILQACSGGLLNLIRNMVVLEYPNCVGYESNYNHVA